jgi:acyl-homoserine-lactone acylase
MAFERRFNLTQGAHLLRPRVLRPAKLALCISVALTAVGCGSGGGSAAVVDDSTFSVEIRRTAFGVPHINGKDLKSAAYGLAYAYAQDNICIAADRILTVAGERSKYLGGAAASSPGSTLTNLRSDFYYRNILDQAALDKAFANASQVTKDAAAGYVAGYNRFLKDAKDADFGVCASAAWAKRPLTENDLRRHMLALATQSGAGAFLTAIADAVPPANVFASAVDTPATRTQVAKAAKPLTQAQLQRGAQEFARAFDERPMGSNGQAFGSAVTDNARGVLIGNPHFPWSGILRFYQAHVTVPGQYDVMGAGLGLVPIPQIGFNKDVAWTHTVSTGRRFTLFELTLNGTNYMVEGVARPITRKTVTVDVLENGVVTPQTRTYYSTHYGPILVSAGIGVTWTTTKAFAIRDANMDNGRILDTVWAMGRATSNDSLRDAITQKLSLPWVNTIAADRAGNAFYADISVTPNVNAAHLATCATSPQAQTLAAARTYLLDGSKAACDWPVDTTAASPGIMAGANMPQLSRKDYVGNSNESAWLANPNQLITGLSPLIGDEAKAQSLRTRMAFTQVADRLAGTDGLAGNKVSADNLEAIFFQNRMQSAELLMPAVLTLCAANTTATATNGTVVNLAAACGVLANWDKRARLASVGTPVFREFWRRAQAIPGLYATPFSATNPVGTPRDPAVTNPTVAAALLKALADGVVALNTAGVSLTAELGSVQGVTRAGVRIPMHGGDEFEGIYNKMTPPGLAPGGYTDIVSGGSYIQIVTFDDTGPVAKGILAYSQSTNAASPYFADQTAVLGGGKFVKLPFRESEIAADPKLSATLVLKEK